MSKALIRGCQNNEPQCQRKLLELYAGYTLSVIRRYCQDESVSQDILQETWISIFQNIQKYEERGHFKAWAAKVAIRKCFRHKKRTFEPYDEAAAELICTEAIATEQLAFEDLMKVVDSLSYPAREVFKLYVIDGLSHKEIADLLHMAESTSRVHLTNARKKLKANIIELELNKR